MKFRIGIATLVATLSLLGLTKSHKAPAVAEAPETEEIELKAKHSSNGRWELNNATPEEQKVLDYFQDQGITDKAALAVLLGNVKQESKFVTDICEGGKRTGYHNCHRGGFGLIQWTTPGRYDGLKRWAKSNSCDPNKLDCQLGYLTSEIEWRKVEHGFKKPGNSVNGYMNYAKRWLGWGVHGARTTYSWEYHGRLV